MKKLFKKEEFKEALEMMLNAKSANVEVKLHSVNSEDTDIQVLFGYENRLTRENIYAVVFTDSATEWDGVYYDYAPKYLRENVDSVAEFLSKEGFNRA